MCVYPDHPWLMYTWFLINVIGPCLGILGILGVDIYIYILSTWSYNWFCFFFYENGIYDIHGLIISS